MDHIKIVEVPKPLPKGNEVLIKVQATPVTTGDLRIQSLTVPRGFKFLVRVVYGFSKPRQSILGTQLAGTVEAIGEKVTKFKVGDEVIAESAPISLKPKSLSFEEAAALSFGGVAALDYLKYKTILRAGDRLLVHGASGSAQPSSIKPLIFTTRHLAKLSNFRSLAAGL